VKHREYCCCAIPLVHIGIYAVLIEQLTLEIVVGALSVATRSIIGASTPSFAKWILAAICFVAIAVQVLGFIGVAKDKGNLFLAYLRLHAIAMLGAFSVAAVWIILSGTRHSNAQTTCENTLYRGANGTIASEGITLCNIFAWVDVGVMAGLWVLLLILQIYMYIVASSFGRVQRDNYLRRSGYYDSIHGLTADIPMADRDPWNGRPSMSYHERKDSTASNVSGDKLYSQGGYNRTSTVDPYYQDSRQAPSTHYQGGYERAETPPRLPPLAQF